MGVRLALPWPLVPDVASRRRVRAAGVTLVLGLAVAAAVGPVALAFGVLVLLVSGVAAARGWGSPRGAMPPP